MSHMREAHAQPAAPAVQSVSRPASQDADGSWWADPAIQRDYRTFHAAAEARWPHMDQVMTWPGETERPKARRLGFSVFTPWKSEAPPWAS